MFQAQALEVAHMEVISVHGSNIIIIIIIIIIIFKSLLAQHHRTQEASSQTACFTRLDLI